MTDILGYRGKRVIVTGCFSGMGEATARTLLSLDAEVHGLDYKDCTLPLASFNKVDLRDPASIDAAVATVGGRVDALFNCAGLPQTSGAIDVMKVNFAGTRHITERVLDLMEDGGAIASIASNGGLGWSRRLPVLKELLAQPGFDGVVSWCERNEDQVREGYSLSKEAVIVWTMTESSRLIERGIRINCINPGPTDTPMMPNFEQAAGKAIVDFSTRPINRRSTPAEQATPLIFLNSDAATYVNGVVLPVDGGFMAAFATGAISVEDIKAAAGGRGH